MGNAASSLAAATQRLSIISDTPRLDAELLLAHALGISRSEMLLRLPDLDAVDAFTDLIGRRAEHEPVAYIIGRQHFWDLELSVTPDVLIPRGDSETLIEAAQGCFLHEPPKRIIDLGTGSGALLLAALSLFPAAHGVGIDASEAALSVARANAQQLGFGERSAFHCRNWQESDWQDKLGLFDLILCNPPYVERDAELVPQVSDYEPHSALFAGKDGLDDYRLLIPQMPALLEKGGYAIFELGFGQEDAVSDLAATAGLTCAGRRDLAGVTRALVMTQANFAWHPDGQRLDDP